MPEIETVTSLTAESPPAILLAEDDPVTRMLMTRFLKKAGYEVQVVTDGEAALKEVETSVPSLLLIDYRMPVNVGQAHICPGDILVGDRDRVCVSCRGRAKPKSFTGRSKRPAASLRCAKRSRIREVRHLIINL